MLHLIWTICPMGFVANPLIKAHTIEEAQFGIRNSVLFLTETTESRVYGPLTIKLTWINSTGTQSSDAMPNLFSPTGRNSRRRSNRWICVTPSATPTSSVLVYVWCLPSWMLSLCKQRSASRKYGQVYASFALNVLYRIVDVKSRNTKNTLTPKLLWP